MGYNEQMMAARGQDVPATARAKEIVAEARRRLAGQNGSASSMPAMIQRIQREFAMRDASPDHMRAQIDGNEPRMPSNMDQYLDQVLNMAGMKAGGDQFPPAPAAPNTNTANVPVPTPRPDYPAMNAVKDADMDPNVTADPDNDQDAAADTDNDQDGWPLWAQIAAAIGGLGATGLTAAGLIGKSNKGARLPAPAAPVDANNVSSRIKGNAVDQSINETLGLTPDAVRASQGSQPSMGSQHTLNLIEAAKGHAATGDTSKLEKLLKETGAPEDIVREVIDRVVRSAGRAAAQ